ncbi:MAG: phosphatidylserine decarboxylase [Gemmatales bacterium]
MPHDDTYPGFGKEVPITSVQPGGGWGMSVELAWGRFRRWILRTFFPQYVMQQLARRQGECTACSGMGRNCHTDVIDERDLKYFSTVCGYHFPEEGNQFVWRRRLPFASWGLAELVTFSLISLVIGMITGWLAWLSVPPWIIWLVGIANLLFWLEIIWFFRNPTRVIPDDAQVMVSPADGTIVELAEVNAEGFPNGRAFRVGIFLSVFNVHINRTPCACRITRLRYYPGKMLNAMKAISARVNEQMWIDMEHQLNGMPMRVTQISGALARRIVCELKPGQTLAAGEAFGMIKLGSRTELYLPSDTAFDLKVKVGDTVQGGSTVLLRLK